MNKIVWPGAGHAEPARPKGAQSTACRLAHSVSLDGDAGLTDDPFILEDLSLFYFRQMASNLQVCKQMSSVR